MLNKITCVLILFANSKIPFPSDFLTMPSVHPPYGLLPEARCRNCFVGWNALPPDLDVAGPHLSSLSCDSFKESFPQLQTRVTPSHMYFLHPILFCHPKYLVYMFVYQFAVISHHLKFSFRKARALSNFTSVSSTTKIGSGIP